MNIEQIRLELVKLTYNHGRDASEAVDRAKALESYGCQKSSESVPEVPKKVVRAPKTSSGNSGIPSRKTAG